MPRNFGIRRFDDHIEISPPIASRGELNLALFPVRVPARSGGSPLGAPARDGRSDAPRAIALIAAAIALYVLGVAWAWGSV